MTNFLSGDNLYRDVVTYTQFGDHRTAGEGEKQTTDWIAKELEKAGFQITRQPVPARQFFIREANLTVGSQKLECFPWWLPRATGPRPVRAQLSPLGAGELKGRIALVKYPPTSPAFSSRDVSVSIRAAVETRAVGVVVVCKGPANVITAQITPGAEIPWPVPVVLVKPGDETMLNTAAERSTEAAILIDGSEEMQAQAVNVVGRLGSGKDIIVVSTPKSGWFTCGGERGPGVALFLGLARWVGQRQPGVSYLFDANTGHELAGLGIRQFVTEMAPPPSQIRFWIHLGANIATWEWASGRADLAGRKPPTNYPVFCDSEATVPIATKAFAHLPFVKPVVGRGLGEMTLVIESGYRGFGVNGTAHPLFHTTGDGPEVTAPELLEPVGQALIKALEMVEAMA